MALFEDYSSTELKEEVLQVLSEHAGIMDARELIEAIHHRLKADREDVRRAMLRLAAESQIAYTSDWKVKLTKDSLQAA